MFIVHFNILIDDIWYLPVCSYIKYCERKIVDINLYISFCSTILPLSLFYHFHTSRKNQHFVNWRYLVQTCRCHGMLLEDGIRNKIHGYSCPVTGHDLETCNVIESSVKVGEKTLLFLPSFQSSMKFQRIASIDFHVIERINLGSLSEGRS